jgi:hypothetical protein
MRVVRTLRALAFLLAIAGCEHDDQASARTFTLSSWCWESEFVQDERVRQADLAFAKAHAIDSMYIQLSSDYEEATQFEGLATLARSGQNQGLSLRWVEGRPEWALPENHAQALAAIDHAGQINLQLMAAGRTPIQAIVYDVEPWVLPEWEESPAALIAGYLAMVERLHDAAARAGLALWVALPFWFETEVANNAPDEPSVLERVDGVLVMAYRDNAEDIERAARPMVEHAQALHVPVIVGVETKCVSPSFISFCGSTGRTLGEALSGLRTRFERDRAVLGFAVHELSSWRALDGS